MALISSRFLDVDLQAMQHFAPVRNAKWQGWIALALFAVGQFDERAPVLDIWEGEGLAWRGARSPLAPTMAL
jgi:hypothetical protein